MLTELRVKNLAVIADVTIPLRAGLNVLTGETGAGKSMLIDALALLLGERASGDLVRPGADRAVVEAVFEVSRSADVVKTADELGVDLGEESLVVRREISAEGRNRAWANGSPSTVAALGKLGSLLVDLHGQHEAQSLLKPAAQRDILDAFGGAEPERRRVRVGFDTAEELRQRESGLTRRRDDIRKRADYLRHVAKEITSAQLKAGEAESLDVEVRRLNHAEELIRLATQLAESLEGDEDRGALPGLGIADKMLSALEQIDPETAKWREMLDSATVLISELGRTARDYAGGIELDPGRLGELERRYDLLYRLRQKYGATVELILETGESAKRELDTLDTADGDLAALSERRGAVERELADACAALTKKRRAAATKLSKAVEHMLPGLGLPGGKFQVEIKPLESSTGTGADQVAFLVQLNVGLEARPLAQVASGGELSRLMLALKVVLAAHDAVPTLVFDEVDSGVGAEVGIQVADALAKVGVSRQVLVITHLAQIAARAGHHVKVTKAPKRGVATADVSVLDAGERVEEVARLLGGPNDPALRRHAEELLARRVPA